MANSVIMPRQGQSVESCIITTWHKKKGDTVNVGDILFSYETDKSAFDEPSQFAGTVLEILGAEGDVIPCLDTVCIIGEPGEDITALLGDKGKEDAPAAADSSAAEAAPEEKKEAPAPAAPAVTVSDGERIRISPRAKNLALKTGADMTKVAPTGPHGRIIERDINAALDAGYVGTVSAVEDFLAGKLTAAPAENVAAAPAAAASVAADDLRAYTEMPLTNVRKVIAKAMHASLSEMAQLTLNSSFDATSLLAYRKLLKAKGEAMGLGKVTINDMVLYAVSRILPNYPEINANLVDDKFRTFAHANVGMAVDTDRGLLVPVIFGAEKLSLADISASAKRLAGAAREGALSPDEMSGGSFTVTNLGSMGVESFTPVINPPQTAILGVCCTTNRMKADGTVYPAMGLSLTFDHRAVDGAPAARFLHELCEALENFELLLAK